VQELTNVAPRQFLTIEEPSQLKATISPDCAAFYLSIVGWSGVVYSLESSTNLTDWNFVTTLTNQAGNVAWTNQPNAQNPAVYFRINEN
jgi:hypothetical protein